MSDVEAALSSLSLDRRDDVAVAISDQLAPEVAAEMARRINERLRQAGVPAPQRTWIIATRGNDLAAARVAAVVADFSDTAPVVVHNPREPDDLTFARRIPGQRRGGIYLNHAWQAASVRIVCGEPKRTLIGLSAWFNGPRQLEIDDLNAALLL